MKNEYKLTLAILEKAKQGEVDFAVFDINETMSSLKPLFEKLDKKILTKVEPLFTEQLFQYNNSKEIPLILLHEYTQASNKTIEESIVELYPKIKKENKKLFETLVANQESCYELFQFANSIKLAINTIINCLVANEKSIYGADIFETLSSIKTDLVKLKTTSFTLSFIRDKVCKLIENDEYQSNDIQMLILHSYVLEHLLNNEFYLMYDQYADNDLLNIIDGNFSDYPLFALNSNNQHSTLKSLKESIQNNVINKIKELINSDDDKQELQEQYENLMILVDFVLPNHKYREEEPTVETIVKIENDIDKAELTLTKKLSNFVINGVEFDVVKANKPKRGRPKKETIELEVQQIAVEEQQQTEEPEAKQKEEEQMEEQIVIDKDRVIDYSAPYYVDELDVDNQNAESVEMIVQEAVEIIDEIDSIFDDNKNIIGYDEDTDSDIVGIGEEDHLAIKKLYHKMKGGLNLAGLTNWGEVLFVVERMLLAMHENRLSNPDNPVNLINEKEITIFTDINRRLRNYFERLKENYTEQDEVPVDGIFDALHSVCHFAHHSPQYIPIPQTQEQEIQQEFESEENVAEKHEQYEEVPEHNGEPEPVTTISPESLKAVVASAPVQVSAITNQVFYWDNNSQQYIINNSVSVTINQWGDISRWLREKIGTLLTHNNDIAEAVEAGQDVYFEMDWEYSWIIELDEIINQLEQLSMFKTAAMLYKLRYLIYLMSYNSMKYDGDVSQVTIKALNPVYSLIENTINSFNHENFEHIVVQIDNSINFHQFILLKDSQENGLEDRLIRMEENIKEHIGNVYTTIDESYQITNKLSAGFSQYTIASQNMMTRIINNQENDVLSEQIHSLSGDIKHGFKVQNENDGKIYKAIEAVYNMVKTISKKKSWFSFGNKK